MLLAISNSFERLHDCDIYKFCDNTLMLNVPRKSKIQVMYVPDNYGRKG